MKKTTAETRPKIINFALYIYLITVVISIISVSINIYFAPPEQSRIFLISFAILIVAFMLFVGKQFYSAKNWSRIFLAVIVCYGSISYLIEPGIPHHPIVMYLQWALYPLGIIYTVILFLPKSNQWFKSSNL